MTKSEAIEKLKNMRLFMQIEDKNNGCKFTEDDYKANEMVIQALDNLLTTEARTHTAAEINAKIDEFMTLFKLIEAKDAFENFFIKKLANRCLYNLTVLKECQTYLIEQLKHECGTFFVTKSEEMIADIANSIELSKTFNDNNADAASTIEMNYYVNVSSFGISGITFAF